MAKTRKSGSTKKATARAPVARKSAKKATKKTAKKSTRRPAKKAAKQTAKKAAKKTAKRAVRKTAAKGARKATTKKATKKTTKKPTKKATKKVTKKAAKKTAKKATKKTAKKAKKVRTKRTPSAAFMRAMTPDAALAAVVGNKSMPRTEVTKKVWEYVRKHNLQDPVERRMINADENLGKVFDGRSRVSMFEMTKYVNNHLS